MRKIYSPLLEGLLALYSVSSGSKPLTTAELRKKLMSKRFSPNALEKVINKFQRQYDRGAQIARFVKSPSTNRALELKRTVSDIKSEVHNQLEHTFKTQRRMKGITHRINKMQAEGLNNAINSNTIVVVLIVTVAFAAIFTVPGQYPQNTKQLAPGMSGEANIAPNIEFLIFVIFDSTALFISLAVVILQTSVVVIEREGREAKKQMTAIINKLTWIALYAI
ncbi:unnamed protein product [Vicia faba]|uniref:PGG domain-containing protein n=1 Tax=Vicia faba TaxID=3906 RepID=A0AAV0ZHM5_VICFA|nr:unnamed protein product [Vicia faba]